MDGTFYWHDYETTGVNPSIDRPLQFAGLRTDENLLPVGEPLTIFCKLPRDILPTPEACITTGITPQHTIREGLSERDFISQIYDQLSAPRTCGVGYNSINFDDEITRYTLYRNFYDPYLREWDQGNSRWDIIDMIRLTKALRPKGFEWPEKHTGEPSFKLEDLAEANKIQQGEAHEALSDVLTTIELAKLVKERQPQLFAYVLQLRKKQSVARLLDIEQGSPFLYIAGTLSSKHHYSALMMPLAHHLTNGNGIICADLMGDVEMLLSLDSKELKDQLFKPADNVSQDFQRPPLRLISVNKCPIVATPKLVDTKAARRLGIDVDKCYANWQKLRTRDLRYKMQQVYEKQSYTSENDAEQRLYEKFLSNSDRRKLAEVRSSSAEELASNAIQFSDERYQELLFSYRARYFPSSLSEDEAAHWFNQCRRRLNDEKSGYCTLSHYVKRLDEMRKDSKYSKRHHALLGKLSEWGKDVEKNFDLLTETTAGLC